MRKCTRCQREFKFKELYLFGYRYGPLDANRSTLKQREMRTGSGVQHLCYSCLNNVGHWIGTPLELKKPRNIT